MAISFVNVAADTAAAGSPQTITIPTGVQENDVMLAFACIKNSTTVTWTFPGGWSQIARQNDGTSVMDVWAKVAGASEANFSVTMSSGTLFQMFVAAYRGVDTSTIEDATEVFSNGAAPSAPGDFTPTGITTNTAGAWAVSFVATRDNNDLSMSTTQSFNDRASGSGYSTTQGSDMSVGMADKEISAAGAVTMPTWQQTDAATSDYAAWLSFSLALKPAGGGNATATPGVVALTTAAPAVTLSAGSRVEPAVAALTVTQPAVTAAETVTATPGVAALTLTQPAVTLSAGSTPTPAAAALTLAQPAVTATGGNGSSLPTLHTANVGLTYYVDGNAGSDSNGGTSTGDAWATLQKAENYLNDTATWPTDQDVRVYIRNSNGTTVYQAGTGNEATLKIEWAVSGSRQPNANRWVIWERYPGDSRPIIKFPSGTSSSNHKYGIRCTTTASVIASYQQFIGLEIDGEATRTNCTNDTVGIYIDRSDFIQIIDCFIHDIQAMDTDDGTPTSKAQGIHTAPNSTDVTVWGCHVRDIGTTTGTLLGQEHGVYLTSANNKVVGCLIHDTLNGFNAQFYNSGAAIDGIMLASSTLARAGESNVVVPGHATNATIVNNILVDGDGSLTGRDGYGINFIPTTATGSGNVINYAVIYGFEIDDIQNSSQAGWTITNVSNSDPLFTNYASDVFTLTGSSPAIGYADPPYSTATDFAGNTRDADPDAGAYEQVSTNATPTPGVAALVLAQPAVTAGGHATPTPAAAALVVAQPAVTLSAGSTPTPAAAALVATQPAVTLSAGSTVTPDAVALLTTQPAVTASAGVVAAPNAAALVVAQPAVTPSAGSTPTPAAAALTVAQPAVVLSAGSTPTPDAAALVLAQPAVVATGSGSAVSTPDTAALAVAQPAVALSAGSTVEPAAAALALAQPAVTPQAGQTASPDAAALTVAQPAVTPAAGSTSTPSAAALTTAQPAVTLSAGSTASPDTAALTVTQPAVALSAGSIVSPAVVVLTLAVPAASSFDAPPDPNPIEIEVHERAQAATIREKHHPTIRERAHTVTVRP